MRQRILSNESHLQQSIANKDRLAIKSANHRSSRPEVFLGKSAKQNNFIEMTLQHGCSPVNLLHIFRGTWFNIERTT